MNICPISKIFSVLETRKKKYFENNLGFVRFSKNAKSSISDLKKPDSDLKKIFFFSHCFTYKQFQKRYPSVTRPYIHRIRQLERNEWCINRFVIEHHNK